MSSVGATSAPQFQKRKYPAKGYGFKGPERKGLPDKDDKDKPIAVIKIKR